MDMNEFPLLNEPNVMLVALKTAAAGPADTVDCLKRLGDSLRLAGLSLPEDDRAVRRMIAVAYRCLHIARLVGRDDRGRFVVTPRGRSALKSYPMGIDTSVLARFPEFREFIHRGTRRRDDPATGAPAAVYSEGYMAGLGGDSIVDNPHSTDRSTHLEWENGWCEAHDQKTDIVPPRPTAGAGYTTSSSVDD